MGVDVLAEITIGRPADAVAAYAADPSNAPAWYDNIRSVEWETEPPLQAGSRVAFVARFMGRRLAYTYEIAEFVPDQRLVMRTAQGPFPMETTYTWHAVDEQSTHMTLRNRGRRSRVLAAGGAADEHRRAPRHPQEPAQAAVHPRGQRRTAGTVAVW